MGRKFSKNLGFPDFCRAESLDWNKSYFGIIKASFKFNLDC